MSNAFVEVFHFEGGSLTAANELVYQLTFDQARPTYFIYCETVQDAELFGFRLQQLLSTLTPASDQAAALVESFVTDNPTGLRYRFTLAD